MNEEIPLELRVQDLHKSKSNVQWETMAAFARAAVPAMITFGVGAAVLSGAFAFIGAFIMGSAAAGATALGAATFFGVAAGGAAATIAGGAAGYRTYQEQTERNHVLDAEVEDLRALAQQQGEYIPDPEMQDVKEQIAQEAKAKDNSVVQNILAQGENTFSPAKIAEKAARDVGLTR